MKLSQIKPNPSNPRIIRDDKFNKLVKSIQQFPAMMEKRPIVVDETMTVLGGNMRLRALQHIYGKSGDIPDNWVTVAQGWTEEQKREFVIKDNAAFGEWDWDALANEWNADDLTDWGIDIPVQEDATEIPTGEVKEDGFDPEQPVETVCKKGDTWKLGDHRLMCGDSTDSGSVALLMDGERADMCFTDPPYGMKKESEGVLNDNLKFDDLLEFNKRWIPVSFANLKDNGSWYCWGIDEPLMDIYSNILKPMMRANQITFRNLITWFKNPSGCGDGQNNSTARSYGRITEKCLFVMCGKEGYNINTDNYFEGWEPIRLYLEGEAQSVGLDGKKVEEICGVGMYSHWFTKSQWGFIPQKHYDKLQAYYNGKAFTKSYEELDAQWYSTRAYFNNTHDLMTEVWQFDRVTTEERLAIGHATPKPIALCGRGIKTSSREGEIVLDVFGGSGSTLIACEQLNRKCYMMELDPHYCDVIIARWEKFTGRKAERVREGMDV